MTIIDSHFDCADCGRRVARTDCHQLGLTICNRTYRHQLTYMSNGGQHCPVVGCVSVTDSAQHFCDHFNAVHHDVTPQIWNSEQVRTIIQDYYHLKLCLQCHRYVYMNDSELETHLKECRSCPISGCDYKNDAPWDTSTFLAHIRSPPHSRRLTMSDASLQLYFTYHGIVQCEKCLKPFAKGNGINLHRGKCVGVSISDGHNEELVTDADKWLSLTTDCFHTQCKSNVLIIYRSDESYSGPHMFLI